MSKRLKYTLLTIMTAITLAFVGLGLFTPGIVFADLKDKNNLFKFNGSCYLYYRDKEGTFDASDFRLCFKLDKLSTKYNDVREELKPWWDSLDKSRYGYAAEVYRKNADNTFTKLVTEAISYERTSSGSASITFLRQKHVYYDEIIEFAEPMFTEAGGKVHTETESDGGFLASGKVGNLAFKNKYKGFDSESPFVTIDIIPQSASAEYYVKFSYEIFRYTSAGIFSNYSETISGNCTTDSKSLYDKLSEMQSLGVLSESITGNAYEYANKVINNREKKSISVKYLVQIPGTPFATMKTESAEAYAVNNVITREDIASALGKASFDCIGSYCDNFTVEGSTYTAHYYKGKYLKARTVDGNEDTVFLDINDSYKDFYQPFVDLGLMDSGAFETTFSERVYAPYKEKLAGYSPATIHGYFAFTVIPKSYTLNAMFADIFNVGACKAGAVYGLDYGVSLSPANYQKLLDDFHYSYLKRIWNGFMDLLELGEDNANVYVMYVRPEDKTTFVNESGSDDPDDKNGSIGNFWNNTVGAVTGFFGDAWNSVTGFLGGLSGTWKVVIAVAIIAAIVSIVAVYNKYRK